MVKPVKLMQENGDGTKKQIFPISHIDAIIGALSGRGTVEASRYGAKGDGKHDDTKAIQKAVYQLKDGDTLKLAGDFLLSKQGVDAGQHSFAVIIENKNNITLDFTNATFMTNYTNDLPNFFEVIGCDNLHIKGGYFTTTYPSNGNAGIYQGGLYIYGCHKVLVENQEFDNTKYGVMTFSCTDAEIKSILFHHALHAEPISNRPWSGILLYDTVRGIAQNNNIYGGLQDGDLSVFGGATKDCMVLNNRLYSFKYGDKTQSIINMNQGITIDQGPTNTQVSGNMIYGYYFGIDNKANSFQSNISNNFITACKVAISDRRGEAAFADETFETIIKGNVINFGLFPDKTEFNPWGVQAVGVWVEKRMGADISNNKIQIPKEFDTSNLLVAGMYISQADYLDNNDYKTPFKVSNNYITLLGGHDGDYKIVAHGSFGIIINGLNRGSFIGNVMNLPVMSNPLWIKGNNGNLYFASNDISPTNFNTLLFDDTATVDNFYNIGNSVGNSLNGLDYKNQITKAATHDREMIIERSVSSSNYSNIIQFSSKYDGNRAILTVEALQSGKKIYGYNKYLLSLENQTSAVLDPISEVGNVKYRIVTVGQRQFQLQAMNNVGNFKITFKIGVYVDNPNITIG